MFCAVQRVFLEERVEPSVLLRMEKLCVRVAPYGIFGFKRRVFTACVEEEGRCELVKSLESFVASIFSSSYFLWRWSDGDG